MGSNVIRKRETKILATLGPSSSSPAMVRALMQAGADGFRLNMSHLRAEQLGDCVKTIREAEAEVGKPVAVVVDLGGPKIRVGKLPDKQLELVEGCELVLGADIPGKSGTGMEIVLYCQIEDDVC